MLLSFLDDHLSGRILPVYLFNYLVIAYHNAIVESGYSILVIQPWCFNPGENSTMAGIRVLGKLIVHPQV